MSNWTILAAALGWLISSIVVYETMRAVTQNRGSGRSFFFVLVTWPVWFLAYVLAVLGDFIFDALRERKDG